MFSNMNDTNMGGLTKTVKDHPELLDLWQKFMFSSKFEPANTRLTSDEFKELYDVALKDRNIPGNQIFAESSVLHGTIIRDGNIFNPYIHRTYLPFMICELMIEICKDRWVQNYILYKKDTDALMPVASLDKYAVDQLMSRYNACLAAAMVRGVAPRYMWGPNPLATDDVSSSYRESSGFNRYLVDAMPRVIYRNAKYRVRKFIEQESSAMEKSSGSWAAPRRYGMEYGVVSQIFMEIQGYVDRLDRLLGEDNRYIYETYGVRRTIPKKDEINLRKAFVEKIDIVNSIATKLYVRAGLWGTLNSIRNFPERYFGFNATVIPEHEELFATVKDMTLEEGNRYLFELMLQVMKQSKLETLIATSNYNLFGNLR